jgi:hypothetical protein
MNSILSLQALTNDTKKVNQKLYVLQDSHIDQTLDLKLFMLEIRANETTSLHEDINLAEAYLEILNNSLRELRGEVFKTWEILNGNIDAIDNF